MHGGRGLVEEAVWLGHVVVGLLPEEPEGLGLLALMLYAGARRDARRSADGDYVPLSEQDPELWDVAAIDEAERLLQRASSHGRIGRFQLEAACSRCTPRGSAAGPTGAPSSSSMTGCANSPARRSWPSTARWR